MTLSPRAIEAAAKAICVAQGYDPRELDDIGSYSQLPLWKDKLAAAQAAITAYLDALAVDGLCLVPREPTIAMLEAGQQAWLNDPLKRSSSLYRAMLASASTGDSPRQEKP